MNEERNQLGFTEKESKKLIKILAIIVLGMFLVTVIVFIINSNNQITYGNPINEQSINDLVEFSFDCFEKYNGSVDIKYLANGNFASWNCDHN